MLVAYFTLTAPAVPPLRLTARVTCPALCATPTLVAAKATTCAVEPVMATDAVAGVPVVAPLGCDNVTLKLKVPLNAVVLIGTTMDLAVASPAAQLRVPDFAV